MRTVNSQYVYRCTYSVREECICVNSSVYTCIYIYERDMYANKTHPLCLYVYMYIQGENVCVLGLFSPILYLSPSLRSTDTHTASPIYVIPIFTSSPMHMCVLFTPLGRCAGPSLTPLPTHRIFFKYLYHYFKNTYVGDVPMHAFTFLLNVHTTIPINNSYILHIYNAHMTYVPPLYNL